MRHKSICITSLLYICFVVSPNFAAEPYVPANDNEVLETLPRELVGTRSDLARLRGQLSAAPDNAELAAGLAELYMQMGTGNGDPRYYGYARAVLQPWWEPADVPVAMLKLRAKLKEQDHQYVESIEDLQRIHKLNPRDAQTLIEMANSYRVLGKYREARELARQLGIFADRVPVVLCEAPLQALTGDAEVAYDTLTQILPLARKQYPGTVKFMITMQGEIARALGRDAAAEAHFLQGLETKADDKHLLRTYADFLLDRDRADEALALLRDHTLDDGILLRAAIAARRLGQRDLAADWTRELASRFEETRLRGSLPHGRYEARCALELQDNPQHAVKLAAENWSRQKELRDTRNLLEAAIAAKDTTAARPAIEFLEAHHTQDVDLERLVKQLRTMQ